MSQNSNQSNLSFPIAFSALVMGAIAMGASPVFVRTAEVGPFASAFWRVALALPLLLVWAFCEHKKAPHSGSVFQFTSAALLSGLFFTGDLIFWHLSILKTTMANATLMACLAPVWVVLFSGAFIGEKVGRNSFIGLIICLLGAALLMGSSLQLAPERLIGDLYGIVTSLFFGLYFLSMRVGRRTQKSGPLILTSSIVTAALLLVAAIISGNQFLPDTASGYISLLTLGIFSHAGGQGLLTVALGALSAVFSSLVIFMEAVAAAFLGWLIFSEPLSLGQWLGGGLILYGIWVGRPKTDT